jgi:hypothetical protein
MNPGRRGPPPTVLCWRFVCHLPSSVACHKSSPPKWDPHTKRKNLSEEHEMWLIAAYRTRGAWRHHVRASGRDRRRQHPKRALRRRQYWPAKHQADRSPSLRTPKESVRSLATALQTVPVFPLPIEPTRQWRIRAAAPGKHLRNPK